MLSLVKSQDMCESEIGISGRVSSCNRFSGSLKQTANDFHVHEVNMEGRQLHLTEMICLKKLHDLYHSKRKLERGEEMLFLNYFISQEIRDKLVSEHSFTKEDVVSLETFIQETIETSPTLANKSATLPKDTSPTKVTMEVCVLPTLSKSDFDLNEKEMPPFETVLETSKTQSPSPISTTLNEKKTFLTQLNKTTSLGDSVREAGFSKCYLFGDSTLTTLYCVPEIKDRIGYEMETQKNSSVVHKLKRKAMHQAIQLYFPFLYSETATIVDTFKKNNLSKKKKIENFCKVENQESDSREKTLPLVKSSVVCVQFKPCALKYLFPFHCQNVSTQTQSLPVCSQADSLINSTEETTLCLCRHTNNPLVRKRKRKKSHSSQSEDDIICPVCNKRQTARKVNKNAHIKRWPKERPAYLFFHLYKMNRDTAEAIQMICRVIHCNSKVFTYAGTKDRCGITVQGVTGFHISIEQMHQALLHPQWDKNVKVSNFQYTNERLNLGHLQGNHFKVCIRNVPLNQMQYVDKAIQQLMENGFINFFGSQRFGTRRIRTHHIGIKLLQSDFEASVHLILGLDSAKTSSTCSSHVNKKDEPGCQTNVSECQITTEPSPFQDHCATDTNLIEADLVSDTAKNFDSQHAEHTTPIQKINKIPSWKVAYNSGNVQSALRMLPRHLYLERTILESLLTKPGDYISALQVLPKNVITLYIHAVQSLIWNHVASYRLQTYGLQPRLGDFIAIKEEGIHEANGLETFLKEDHPSSLQDTESIFKDKTLCEKVTFSGIQHDTKTLCEEGTGIPTETLPVDNSRISPYEFKFFVVKETNQLENLSPFDIILPVPGHGVLYPDYLKQLYIETCQKILGITLENICKPKISKIGDCFGGYRFFRSRPTDVHYRSIYDFHNDACLVSDEASLIKNNGTPTFVDDLQTVGPQQEQAVDHEPGTDTSNAVVFSCTLPKSSYLTMACREILSN